MSIIIDIETHIKCYGNEILFSNWFNGFVYKIFGNSIRNYGMHVPDSIQVQEKSTGKITLLFTKCSKIKWI